MQRIVYVMLIATVLVACGQSDDKSWLPPADAKGDVLLGQKHFAQHCASCHGHGAMGSDKGPPLVHKIYEPSHHGDAAFYMAARNGARSHHWQFGDMPAIKDISADDMLHVIAYVRQLQRQSGIH